MTLTTAFGAFSAALFALSQVPTLFKAVRTRDLESYSLTSLVMANVGNLLYSVYVISLPAGPIWFLHGFSFVITALMLGLRIAYPTRTLTSVQED
ncbi:MAG: hypothetical protein LCH82_18470 [Actinobacteria bacterium]|nr:hypothetical protein [Actinomycetota bacterium]